jgi:putative methyltransferase (TIGR04325 family)
MTIKKIIKNLTPPAFIDAYRYLRYGSEIKKYGYFGDYPSWDAARADSGGYESAGILKKVKDSLLEVKAGRAAYERDSVLMDKTQYSWPLASALLWMALKNGGKINLIDFGGSLGSTYYQNLIFLNSIKEVNWNIVEQPDFVKCGREYFEDGRLKFYSDFKSCSEGGVFDAVLFSSSLQYFPSPYDTLAELLDSGAGHIILDRTPFWDFRDRICVQRVPPEIYQASYPCMIFNYEKMLKFLSVKYDIVYEFTTDTPPEFIDGQKIEFKGFLMSLKKEVERL